MAPPRPGEYFFNQLYRQNDVIFFPVFNFSYLHDSLQLQHSTNLNIQRSQSTHRFGNATNMIGENNQEHGCTDNAQTEDATRGNRSDLSASASDSNYMRNSNVWGKRFCFVLFCQQLLIENNTFQVLVIEIGERTRHYVLF